MSAAATGGPSAAQAFTPSPFGPLEPLDEVFVSPDVAINQARATLCQPLPSYTARKRLTPAQALRGERPRTPTPRPRTPKLADATGLQYPKLRSSQLNTHYIPALLQSLDTYMTTLHQGVAPLLGDSLSPHRPVFYAKDLSYDFENHDLDRKLFGWIDKSVVAVLNTLTSPLSLTWSASHDNFASLSVGSGETRFLSTVTSDYAVTPDGLEFLGGRGEVEPGKRQYMSDVHNYLTGLDSFPPTRISSSEDKKKEVLQVQKADGSWSGGTKHELMALQVRAPAVFALVMSSSRAHPCAVSDFGHRGVEQGARRSIGS